MNQARDKPDTASRRALGEQYNELMEQMQEIAKDSQYQGTNLLQNNETLTIQFHQSFDESLLRLDGINLEGPGIRGTGLKNDIDEVPPSTVLGVFQIAALASAASFGSVSGVASQAFEASAAARISAGSTISFAAQASASSIASFPAMTTSQGSIAALPPGSGGTPAISAQPSQGSIPGIQSKVSVASRPFISSVTSTGSSASIRSNASIASRNPISSLGSITPQAAVSINQQYAFTLNANKSDFGTNNVIGLFGHGLNSTALGEHEVDWGARDFKDSLKGVAIQLEKFSAALNVELSNIATNTSVLQIREEFTDELMTTLRIGSDKLVLADMNQEGANLQALEVRQALGLEALVLASQQSQAILRLLQ